MINPRRLQAVARKEFLHVLRDWRSLFLAIAIPALLIVLFGYALNLDLDNIPTVVWDQSGTPESRDLLSQFQGSPYFKIVAAHDNYRALQEALEKGTAMIALVIPWDFAEAVRNDKPTALQVIADGSDATRARLALGYAGTLGSIFNQSVLTRRMDFQGRKVQDPPVELKSRAWFNADLRSQNETVPGILVIVIIVIAAMLTSITVAKEWEMGTMEQLISTPVRVPELVFGKVAPYFVIGFVDMVIAVVMGRYLFGVPFRGNVALLFCTASIFLAGALFFGLMVSIVFKKQVLANQTALLASYLPTMMLSGFVFDIDNMPRIYHYLTYLVPARYILEILRAIYLKGVGLEILWFNALLLCVYACLMVALCLKRLKLTLE